MIRRSGSVSRFPLDPPMSGKHWSVNESAELLRLYNAGVGMPEAAGRIGRSYAATRHKALRMGLVGSEYALRGASTDAAVMAYLPGRTVPETAAGIGITRAGVLVAVRRLIARGFLAKDGYRGPYRATEKWTMGDEDDR